jgi:beta-lactamase regulating signal transducer with metallopeptidase domain
MNVIENILNPFQSAQFVALFCDTLLKSFVVLALAGGVCVFWRRASAATRHLIWFLAVASLPILPLLSSSSPWQKPLWTISTASDSGNQISLALQFAPKTIAQNSTVAPDKTVPSAIFNVNNNSRRFATHFSANWMLLGLVTWSAGCVVILVSISVGQYRLHLISRQARPLKDPVWMKLLNDACDTLQLQRKVTFLQSPDDVMPMTWGWRRSVILLPAESSQWPDERRRIVLLHELAHVKRRDCLTQLVAQIVCAIYWFNPLVWLAARQMRAERELACDDLVLSGGCKPSDYAGHLVEIAATFRRVPLAPGIAMARSPQLAGRVAAIVDGSRNRRLRSTAAIFILALIGGIAICIGGNGADFSAGADKANSLRQQQIGRLKIFSAQKLEQSQTLAAAAGETISPEFQKFFTAATTGDSQTVTNMYESFKQRHGQYKHANNRSDPSLRTSFWGPVLEICLVYDHVVRCEPEYTQMAVDGIVNSIPAGSIYFGGTDPGRGLPTAFCKSHANADPFYTLTQNALADGSYLEYLQKTYGDQKSSLNQLATACRADGALQELNAKWTNAVRQLDALEINDSDSRWNAASDALQILTQQRADRVEAIKSGLKATVQASAEANFGGTNTIYIPTSMDTQKCFQDYVADASVRAEKHQLKPGEDFKKEESGRIQVSGQVAVMAINSLLAKIIFDKNPGHEFFIEESFPLDWMYPYLEPHGPIMKINREPLLALPDETVRQDGEYWQPRVKQMIGDWLREDTSVKNVAEFSEKVFLRHDLNGFSGDPRFVQNDYASKMLSKWRGSIAGIYAWRAENAMSDSEKNLMAHAADFAFRQALALCPYSPEAAKRYADFLTSQNREADAKLVMDLARQFKATANTNAAAEAPVFQLRLALDTPMDNTEPMRLVAPSGSSASAETLYVTKEILLDQTAIESAKVNQDNLGHPQIDISFTAAGRNQFAGITRQHLNQRLAIVIDGRLWTAPVVRSEITGGKAVVNGSFSEKEAQELAGKVTSALGK